MSKISPMYLTIGSGDIAAFLSGVHTKGFAKLMAKFVAMEHPYYNSYGSPIDALRTGIILEDRYLFTLSEDYFIQYKAQSKELDCLKSSIDFAKVEGGVVTDFDELKTIFFPDFVDEISPLDGLPYDDYVKVIKKRFKNNYNQIQFQLFCTGLQEANLVFLAVDSYEDESNKRRVIKDDDYIKFRIKRDKEVISKIKERAKVFQNIRDFALNRVQRNETKI